MMNDDQSGIRRAINIAGVIALLALLGIWAGVSLDEVSGPHTAATKASANEDEDQAGAKRVYNQPYAQPHDANAQASSSANPGAPTDRETGTADAGATRKRAQNVEAPDRNVSPNVGLSLSNVIELLNAEKYDDATAALDALLTADAMKGMTPFEISRLYQLSFNLNMQAERYEAANADLQAAIESGGLNAQELSQMQYQRAQLFVQMEDYAKAADSLELWIAQEDMAEKPAAYYLLAASYYYQDKFDDARDHMETLFSMPGEKQEGWYSLMSAIYLQKQDYAKALPVVERMVDLYGDETYRAQRAGLYLQTRDYAKAEAALAEMVDLYGDEKYVKQLADVRRFNAAAARRP